MANIVELVRSELRGALRFRRLAVMVAWGICVAGWIYVFTLPNVFEAKAQVYVDPNTRLADVMGEVGVAPEIGARVFVVRQAMLGRPQLAKVAAETGLDSHVSDDGQMEKLIQSLRENIVVSSGFRGESRNLYDISYRSKDRDTAINVVQTLLDAFVEDVLEMNDEETSDVSDYLQDQLNHYSGLLSQAETALAEFKKEHVGLLPGDKGGVFERLQQRLDQIAQLKVDLKIENDRRAELRRQMSPDSSERASLLPGLANDPVSQNIVELERRRSELLLSYTAKHPDVVALNEQLEQLHATRAAGLDDNQSSEGRGGISNPVSESIQIALNESSVRIATLRSQIAQLESEISTLQNQIDTIPAVEADYTKLTRDYEQYRSLYNELLMTRERERLAIAGDEQDVVSFYVIDPPAAPLEPVSPPRSLLIVAVLILGCAASAGLAYLLHLMHPVFTDVEKLRQTIGRPILGSISMVWNERRKTIRHFEDYLLPGTVASLVVLAVIMILAKDSLVSAVYLLSSTLS